MNKRQKIVLLSAVVVIVGMLIYPPFHYRYASGSVQNLGYGWLFDPPILGDRFANLLNQSPTYVGSVDVLMLIVQWVGAIIVAAVFFVVLKDKTT